MSADFAQARTKWNTYDKHKHLSSSLRRGFCTSVLFILSVITAVQSLACEERFKKVASSEPLFNDAGLPLTSWMLLQEVYHVRMRSIPLSW